jgi:pyrroloquinoline quinone biosynthesis protein B
VCAEARRNGGHVIPRTQSSAAISADGVKWFLLNASPDVRAQILSFPPLGPESATARGSGIEAVLLTNADIDHSLGLLLLREGLKLHVHATESVRDLLTGPLTISPVLDAFCGVEWSLPPAAPASLRCADGSNSGLMYAAIPLAGKPPRFSGPGAPATGNVIGFHFHDLSTGGRLLFLPNVAALDDSLMRLLTDADAVLFDGTFWSETEMRDLGVGSQTATTMGHVPISGPCGSLSQLAKLPAKHKIYVHINNTNPILFENSTERAAIARAGCLVGNDGMDIVI